MSRRATTYVCTACGATFPKWAGRCEACGAWNSIEEDPGLASGPGPKRATKGRAAVLSDLAAEEPIPPRRASGIGELDRVLGGGLVPASAILLGGDPGIGKSTLLLQAAAAAGQAGARVVYVSGEEAAAQIRLRAGRLGLGTAPVKLAAETGLRDILAMLDQERPDLAIIDSIQTMWLDHVDSAPGSVS